MQEKTVCQILLFLRPLSYSGGKPLSCQGEANVILRGSDGLDFTERGLGLLMLTGVSVAGSMFQ